MYETNKDFQTPQDYPNSPISGMPVCEVWKGKTVIVFKRGAAQAAVGRQPIVFEAKYQKILGNK